MTITNLIVMAALLAGLIACVCLAVWLLNDVLSASEAPPRRSKMPKLRR